MKNGCSLICLRKMTKGKMQHNREFGAQCGCRYTNH